MSTAMQMRIIIIFFALIPRIGLESAVIPPGRNNCERQMRERVCVGPIIQQMTLDPLLCHDNIEQDQTYGRHRRMI